jgi:hypothetical protein
MPTVLVLKTALTFSVRARQADRASANGGEDPCVSTATPTWLHPRGRFVTTHQIDRSERLDLLG